MTQGSQNLVAASDVTGTVVYGADESRVGTIDRVMIDKVSGKVAYAVMSFGGVLGIGGDERPVPWDTLKYDERLGGFKTAITEQQLQSAPQAETGWGGEPRLPRQDLRGLRRDPLLPLSARTETGEGPLRGPSRTQDRPARAGRLVDGRGGCPVPPVRYGRRTRPPRPRRDR